MVEPDNRLRSPIRISKSDEVDTGAGIVGQPDGDHPSAVAGGDRYDRPAGGVYDGEAGDS